MKPVECSNQKWTDQTLWSFLLYNILTNVPNLCMHIWTYYIAHFSSRISTYLCKRFDNMITTTRSKSQHPIITSPRHYLSLVCMNTAPDINKVTRNGQYTKVGLSPLMTKTSFIHQNSRLVITSHPCFLIWIWVVNLMFLWMSWCCGILFNKLKK